MTAVSTWGSGFVTWAAWGVLVVVVVLLPVCAWKIIRLSREGPGG